MTLEFDLSALPEEVTDFAFDQFNDRLMDESFQFAEEAVLSDEPFVPDYDEQTGKFHALILPRILSNALHEKVNDIEYEVRHGEREDFTEHETTQMRRDIDEIFG